MRRWFLMIMVLLLAIPVMAQVDAESSRRAKQRYIGVGLKAGALIPHYNYWGNPTLNATPKDTALLNLIRPMAGVKVEIPVGDILYVAPELMFIQRGDSRRFLSIPSGDSVLYLARVNYIDLRVPVEVVFPVSNAFQPYLLAGVDVGMVLPYIKKVPILNKPINLSGSISELTSGGGATTVAVNASNMAPFDAGVFGGVGGRFTMRFDRFSLVCKLEVAYSMGLLNTHAVKELNSETPAANLGNGGTHYSVQRRHNSGLECTFSLILPLHFQGGDACSFGSSHVGHSKNVHYGF